MGDSTITWQTEAESRADIYQRITNRIAAAIEAGAREWRMPWYPGAASVLPVDAATGKPHRGVNVVVLWATAQTEGYPSAVRATYRQWAELGAAFLCADLALPPSRCQTTPPTRRHGLRRSAATSARSSRLPRQSCSS